MSTLAKSPSSASRYSSVTLGQDNVTNDEFRFIDFLAFNPQTVGGPETTEIKLLKELDCEMIDASTIDHKVTNTVVQ